VESSGDGDSRTLIKDNVDTIAREPVDFVDEVLVPIINWYTAQVGNG
jgi:hypothetical protein